MKWTPHGTIYHRADGEDGRKYTIEQIDGYFRLKSSDVWYSGRIAFFSFNNAKSAAELIEQDRRSRTG